MACCVAAAATIVHVPSEFATIQSGMDAAADGDTVLVAPGVYYENIRFRGKRILVTAEGSTVPGERAPREEVVIDGSSPANPDSTAAVYFVDGEGADSILEGFTITHEAFAVGYGRTNGTGIVCDRASPTIRNNLIVGNSPHGIRYRDEGEAKTLYVTGNEIRWNASPLAGGGILIEESIGPGGSNATIEGNVFVGNTAHCGGALAVRYGWSNRVSLSDNVVRSNTATWGAGMWAEKGTTDFIVERNLFVENNGAAISISDYDPGTNLLLTNNTIAANTDGVLLEFGNEAVIRNNIIVGNGSGITRGSFLALSSRYNDVWDNDGCDYVGCKPGEGDISEDPLFEGGAPFDYHLTLGSPCIDAGDPMSPQDPDGTRADMGAFYYDQGAGIDDAAPGPISLLIWPNPTEGGVALALCLAADEPQLTVSVYDVLGRLVGRIFDGPPPAGRIELTWDGRDRDGHKVAAGVYFIVASGCAAEARSRIVRLD